MPRFGLVGPTYQAQSVNADAQRCVNFVLERDESGAGRSDIQMYQRPGLKAFASPSFGPVYALIPVPAKNRLFVVTNNLLAEIFADGTVTDKAFPFLGLSLAPVPFAVGPSQFCFVEADGSLWVYDLTTNTLLQHTTSSGNPIPENFASVVYIAGYFVGLAQSSRNLYYSALNDASTWDAADVFAVSVTADYNNAILNDHGELWIFGQFTTVVYSVTADADNPFQPNPSGFIQQGIIAPNSATQLDNTIFWLGGDIRGQGVAWRANGYTPQRISTYAIEHEWMTYSTLADAIGWCYQLDGHSYYVIYFPTADKTWQFDVSSGMWTEMTYFDSPSGAESAFLGRCHAFFFGKHLVGSRKNDGIIYEMANAQADGLGGWNFVTDNGALIRRWRRAPHIANEGERIYIPELQVFLESGLGPIPPFTQREPLAAPVLSLNINGSAMPAGHYEVVIAEYDANGNLLQISDEATTDIAVANTRELTVTFPYLSSGWRVYLNYGTGWMYFDVVGPASGLIISLLNGFVSGDPPDNTRGPQLMLRISKDGGHTWGNEIVRDCGQAGEFAKRVRYLRLGQARDWVFEIAITDPIPLRITDGVILPDYPSSRIATNIRKQA